MQPVKSQVSLLASAPLGTPSRIYITPLHSRCARSVNLLTNRSTPDLFDSFWSLDTLVAIIDMLCDE